MANFGWSLCDSFNPRRTGLANFRTNFMQRRTNVPPVMAPQRKRMDRGSPHRAGSFTSIQQWASDNSVYGRHSAFTDIQQEEQSCIPISHYSDSCIGSDHPSFTSTGSSDSEGGGSRAAECYQKKSKRSRGNSVSSTTSSVDVRRSGGQGSLQHAMAVIEDREEEMSHLFDQLHDIQVDLSQMTDQVGQVTRNLQRCQRRQRRNDPLANRRQSRHGNSGGSSSSSSTTGGVHHAPPGGSRNTTCGYASGGTWNSALTEDEMADIVHRLLTQICEQQMARFEGRNDVPLII